MLKFKDDMCPKRKNLIQWLQLTKNKIIINLLIYNKFKLNILEIAMGSLNNKIIIHLIIQIIKNKCHYGSK